MRLGKQVRWIVRSALVGGLLITTGCGGTSQSPAPHAMEVQAVRAQEYTSVEEVLADSELVVVGRTGEDLRPNPYYGDRETPFAIADLAVTDVVVGDVAPGDTVELSVEAGYADDGSLLTTKIGPDESYLLFLVPQGERSPHTYTIVGYLAGMYGAVDGASKDSGGASGGDAEFVRLDPESPELPEVLTPSMVERVAQR